VCVCVRERVDVCVGALTHPFRFVQGMRVFDKSQSASDDNALQGARELM